MDDPQSDTLEDLDEQTEPTEADCIVSINQETGQKEIYGEPSLCNTEASKQAEEGTVGRDSPETTLDGAAHLQENTAARISESITIVSVYTYIRTVVPMFALHMYSSLHCVFHKYICRYICTYVTAIFDVRTLCNVYTYIHAHTYIYAQTPLFVHISVSSIIISGRKVNVLFLCTYCELGHVHRFMYILCI